MKNQIVVLVVSVLSLFNISAAVRADTGPASTGAKITTSRELIGRDQKQILDKLLYLEINVDNKFERVFVDIEHAQAFVVPKLVMKKDVLLVANETRARINAALVSGLTPYLSVEGGAELIDKKLLVNEPVLTEELRKRFGKLISIQALDLCPVAAMVTNGRETLGAELSLSPDKCPIDEVFELETKSLPESDLKLTGFRLEITYSYALSALETVVAQFDTKKLYNELSKRFAPRVPYYRHEIYAGAYEIAWSSLRPLENGKKLSSWELASIAESIMKRFKLYIGDDNWHLYLSKEGFDDQIWPTLNYSFKHYEVDRSTSLGLITLSEQK